MNSLLLALLLAASTLQQGEKLLLDNKPREAEPVLNAALAEEPGNEKIYLYLGLVYEQLNDPERALQVLRRGLNLSGQYRDLMYLNMGNNYFRQERYNLAEEMYTRALEVNAGQASSYLNRANSRLRLGNFPGTVSDYTEYLRLDPGSPQRPQIERLLALLRGQLDAEARHQEEEAQRQKALLSEVLNSLRNASEDTRNLSAGSEQIEEKYDEVDIRN